VELLKIRFVHEGREPEDETPDFFVSKSGAISPYKRKKPPKPSLKRLANVAKRQNVAVTRTRDGAVTISPTLNAEVASTEWDEALAK
jgi:hypothetical protein